MSWDAVGASRKAQSRYEAGAIAYADAITASSELHARTLLLEGIEAQRTSETVELIHAVGGGWTVLVQK